MKTFTPEAMAEIQRGTAIVSAAVAILCDPRVRAWAGSGTLTLDGEDYRGLGERAFVHQTGGALGGTAQGLTIGLSGIDPVALELLESDEISNAPVIVERLIFSGDGQTLLDHHVFDRGRVDQVSTQETIGGEAAISIALESAARGLGRRGARMRSDADQRLISATDGYFKHTAYAGEKKIYFGGKKPATVGAAIGGAGSPNGGGGGRLFLSGALD